MRANAIQFLHNAAISMSFIFIPSLAKELGANNLQIGFIGAANGVMIFASSYAFGRAADIYGRMRFLRFGLALSVLSFFLQIFASDWIDLVLIRAFTGFTIGIFIPPLLAYAYEEGGPMGRFSSYGSLGWAIGNLVAGLIAVYWGLFALSSLCFAAALAISLKLPAQEFKALKIPIFPTAVIRRNIRVYAAYFLRHTGANAAWIIFPLFLADIGASPFWIGIIYFLNSGSQVLFMRFADRFRDEELVRAGVVFSVLVFLGYGVASDYRQILPLQFLLAASWSSLYVGSVLYMAHRNVEKATSLGMLNSVISISGAIGPLIGGAVAQLWGFRAVMYAAALLSASGYLASRTGLSQAETGPRED